jgi:hypothetical protein
MNVNEFYRQRRESAEAYWKLCRRLVADRAARGGPTLEEMSNEYEALQASGGGDFDPNEPFSKEDALIDAINEEIYARMSLEEYVEADLDRVFGNFTRQVLSATMPGIVL